MSRVSEEHQVAIQDYFRNSIGLDAEHVQSGFPNLPGLKMLTMTICKNLNWYVHNLSLNYLFKMFIN